MQRWFLVVFLLAGLAACGSDPAPTPTNAAPAQAGGDLFSVTITGAVDAQFAGPGLYACDDTAEILGSGTSGSGNALSFVLPPGTSPGEYTLTAERDPVLALLTVAGATAPQQQSGVLRLDAVPAAAGDPVRGSFDVTYQTESGDTLSAVGTFDFAAASACN